MKVYVASSWRNAWQPAIVQKLREAGYDTYDFKDPANAFPWKDIDADHKNWSPVRFREVLDHPLAVKGFHHDMEALKACDACVLVLPCGRSAHVEMGWAVGAGKNTILFTPPNCGPQEPELMYKMFKHICVSMGEVLAALNST